MAYDYPYSGKSLEECTNLLRSEAASGSSSFKTIAYALESLRDSPESIRQYFDTLSEVVEDAIKKQIDRGLDLDVPAQFVASGTVPLEDMGRTVARSQLLHVIEFYLASGLRSEVPRKWNDAVPELKIPSNFLD